MMTWADLLKRRPPLDQPVRMTVGVFDGVHLGHRKLLSDITSDPDANILSLVITFSRSPVEVQSPETFPGSILTYGQKIERIAGLGVRAAVVIDFSEEMSNLSGEAFVRLLKENLTIQKIVVGQNFRFGKKRISGTDDLKEMLSDTEAQILVAEPVLREGSMVSSSRIRSAIRDGDLDQAAEMLAARHAIDLRGIEKSPVNGSKFIVSRAAIRQVLPPPGNYSVTFEGIGGRVPGRCRVGDDSLTLAVENGGDASTVVFT